VWVERLMMSTSAAPVTTFFGSSTNRPVIPGAWLGRDRLAGFVPWDSVLR
jgi:hypothetical protein